jgi:AmmeMemoRadiSam system protein B
MVRGAEAVRTPAVAGSFYPSNPAQLQTAVERLLVRTLPPVTPAALIAPHAGYIYSGATAGRVYACVDLPRRLIVLCPNHTGLGAPIATASGGAWRTPLGDVPVDEELAGMLMRALPEAVDDPLAHRREHAIEVQLPFLQVLLGDFAFVPVVVGTGSLGHLEALGHALAETVSASEGPVAIVVSSDMNHYEDAGTNREKDTAALEAVLRLDPVGLHAVVRERHVSMCGYGPAVAALFACRRLGAERADLVDYSHSGMVTGDDSEVVSYAGVRIYKGPA